MKNKNPQGKPICPKCKNEIRTIIASHCNKTHVSCVANQCNELCSDPRFDGLEAYSHPEGIFHKEYLCPECNHILTTKESKAVKILKGEAEMI